MSARIMIFFSFCATIIMVNKDVYKPILNTESLSEYNNHIHMSNDEQIKK